MQTSSERFASSVILHLNSFFLIVVNFCSNQFVDHACEGVDHAFEDGIYDFRDEVKFKSIVQFVSTLNSFIGGVASRQCVDWLKMHRS